MHPCQEKRDFWVLYYLKSINFSIKGKGKGKGAGL